MVELISKMMPTNHQCYLVRKYFSKRPEVVAVYLYGSQTQGKEGKLSDIDLAVLVDVSVLEKDRHADYYRLLYIDLAMQAFQSDKVDVQIISPETPLAFAYNVVSDGRLLLSNSDSQRVYLKTKIVAKYLDFLPVLNQIYQAMHQRLKAGTYGIAKSQD